MSFNEKGPAKYLTEEQVERRVERMMDHLDGLFLAGEMPQRDYAAAVKSLDLWANARTMERAFIITGGTE